MIYGTILRGDFLHLPTAHRQKMDNLSRSHRCWRQTLYSTGRLIRLGIFFFFFAITLWYVTGLWRQCYIIPHGFTGSERDSWELLCVFAALPLQHASLFLSEWGGLVKCIIYLCLPPWSGSHTKRGPSPWIQHCPAGAASKVSLMNESFWLQPWKHKYNNAT